MSIPRGKRLFAQRPNNAYGIKITDEEIKKFMELFNTFEEDYFQESVGGRIVSDILNGNVLPTKVARHSQSNARSRHLITNTRGNRPCLST